MHTLLQSIALYLAGREMPKERELARRATRWDVRAKLPTHTHIPSPQPGIYTHPLGPLHGNLSFVPPYTPSLPHHPLPMSSAPRDASRSFPLAAVEVDG